jgi:hypothetical protein
MFNYSHLGGSGVGAALQQAFGGQLNPNGPSYNGQRLHFSLLLAPYGGDEPPTSLQADAALYFYPPEIIFHTAPEGVVADTAEDIRRFWQAEQLRVQQASQAQLDPPTAYLANPVSGAAVLVWDAPHGQVVTGYEAAWRSTDGDEWTTVVSGTTSRLQINGLEDGKEYIFKVRAICEVPEGGRSRYSVWTEECTCIPGAVTVAPVGAMAKRLPIRAMIKMVFASLGAVIRSRAE